MTSEKSPEPALRDILDAIDHIRRKLDGVAFDVFEEDLDRRRIIERNVEIISEASRRVPSELKVRYAEIPWHKIAGIGNVLRHDYDTVSPRILWNFSRGELSALEHACRAEIGSLEIKRQDKDHSTRS